ncbi:MAG: gluconate 2-dehydrogenase subunit 3 family protein [Verrucomicrobiales bacterium]
MLFIIGMAEPPISEAGRDDPSRSSKVGRDDPSRRSVEGGRLGEASLPLVRRREALKLLATAGTLPGAARAQETAAPQPPETKPVRPLTDPDLFDRRAPWVNTLTQGELMTITALADTILPPDEGGPAASAVGVPEFINQWVSAPYPLQQEDRQIIRGGLAWLNTESHKRFGKPLHELGIDQKSALCDDICDAARARPEHRTGAVFFARFRDLCATGYYTTPEGMKDLRYVGNVPTPAFAGPPPEVLKHLELA